MGEDLKLDGFLQRGYNWGLDMGHKIIQRRPQIRAPLRTMLNNYFLNRAHSLEMDESHILSDIRKDLDELRKDSPVKALTSFEIELEDYLRDIVEHQPDSPNRQESLLNR